jgi:hypothetical protein
MLQHGGLELGPLGIDWDGLILHSGQFSFHSWVHDSLTNGTTNGDCETLEMEGCGGLVLVTMSFYMVFWTNLHGLLELLQWCLTALCPYSFGPHTWPFHTTSYTQHGHLKVFQALCANKSNKQNKYKALGANH